MRALRSFLLAIALLPGEGVPALAEAVATAREENSTATVEPVTTDSRRAYVAVGGGVALGDFDAGATGAPPRIFRVNDFDVASGSFSLRAGYRVHPRVAAEVMWEYQTGWELTLNHQDDGELTAWNLVANAKGFLLDGPCRPFGIVGIGIGRREVDSEAIFFDPVMGTSAHARGKDAAFVPRHGFGVEVDLADAWTIGGETAWVLGTGDLDSLEYAVTSIVLAWRFW